MSTRHPQNEQLTLDVNEASVLSGPAKDRPQVLVAELARLEEDKGVAQEVAGDVANAAARGLPRDVLAEEQVEGPAVRGGAERGVQEADGHEYGRERQDVCERGERERQRVSWRGDLMFCHTQTRAITQPNELWLYSNKLRISYFTCFDVI